MLRQALELLRSRDYLPDLVLLDVQMPNRTGYEVPAAYGTRQGRVRYPAGTCAVPGRDVCTA